jgi:hypothetical protein
LANHWAEQQRQTGVESNALAGWLGSRVAEPIAADELDAGESFAAVFSAEGDG